MHQLDELECALVKTLSGVIDLRHDITEIPHISKSTSGLLDWVLIAAAVALRIAGGDFTYGAFAILLIFAARGIPQAIQALFLSWLFTSLNGEIFPPVADVELIRALLLLVAAIRIGLETPDQRISGVGYSRATTSIAVFVGFCFMNSLVVSALPVLSLLKTLLFFLLTLSVIMGWTKVGSQRSHMMVWLKNALTAVALLSAPLPLLGMGYEVNGYGFQGLLNQPQGFGIMMALLTTWQLGHILANRLFTFTRFVLLGAFAALLIMSAARTGMLAFMLGTLAAGLLAFLSHRADLRTVLANVPGTLRVVAGGGMIVFSLILSSAITGGIERIVTKGDEDSTLAERFQTSRGQLVESSFERFLEHPVFGNGFAMPSYLDEFNVRYDPIFGLPVSAPVEKGVLPVAVLEELGIFGALIFYWMIFALVREAYRVGQYEMIGLLVCALAINLGEAVLLSPSGFGLLVWLIIGMTMVPVAHPRQVGSESLLR